MNQNREQGRPRSYSKLFLKPSTEVAASAGPDATIRPLPADVVAQLRSSVVITSLTGVVLDLVKNSLDAGARKIEVSLDFKRGGCSVEDDGLGIAPAEFRENGGLGDMHCTSKYGSNKATHGHHGAFIASLAAMSLLTVTSRHHLHRSHNTVVFHQSKLISRFCPAPVQHEVVFRDHGTRVTVRDLFGNMPVRVKRRVVELEGTNERERQWDDFRRDLVGLVLAWPEQVSVRAVDGETGRRLVLQGQKVPLSKTIVAPGPSKIRDLSGDMRYVLALLTQASFISSDERKCWVPASASTSSVSIQGMISLDPAPSKFGQFMSLGITPLYHDTAHNELFDQVNRLFQFSSFGVEEDDSEVDDLEKERRRLDKRYKQDGLTTRQLRGGRKGIDRWPMFCFWITLEDVSIDSLTIDRLTEGTLKNILDVLEVMVVRWLTVHGFRSENGDPKTIRRIGLVESPGASPNQLRRTETPGHLSTPTTEKRTSKLVESRSVRPSSVGAAQRKSTKRAGGVTDPTSRKSLSRRSPFAFGNWSRIKSGNPSFYDGLRALSAPNAKSLSGSPKHAFQAEVVQPGQFGSSLKAQGSGLQPDEGLSKSDTHSFSNDDHPHDDLSVSWTNPANGTSVTINTRTGMAIKPCQRGEPLNVSTEHSSNVSSEMEPLRVSRRSSSRNHKSAPWIEEFLRGWENPVFQRTENGIPKVNTLAPADSSTGAAIAGNCHGCGGASFDIASNEVSFMRSSKISKECLANSRIVSQVDRKFILAVVPTHDVEAPMQSKGDLLVLIDQHAADERCRIETLLAELCTPETLTESTFRSDLGHVSRVKHIVLTQLITFTVSPREAELFRVHAAHMAAWGILYSVVQHRTQSDSSTSPLQCTLQVSALPPGISERCKLDPKPLISLLRSEIWALASGSTRSVPQRDEDVHQDPVERGPHPWIRHLGTAPKGLLDMLASRACRSAIMFNDPLELAQCEELVRKLAACAFPFQCAHGRPSMVPLVEIRAGMEGLDRAVPHGLAKSCEAGVGKGIEMAGGFVKAWKRWKG